MENKDTKDIKVGIITLGCRVNQYESRAIAEYLEARGVTVVQAGEESDEPCDYYIINTCAVTAESERKSRQMARRASRLSPGAKIIVTGCQAQLSPETAAALPGVVYVSGNASKLDAARAVFRINGGEVPEPLTENMLISNVYENYSVVSPDHTRAYIKIEDGCENRCAYCVIPKVRGPVRSKPFGDVVNEVRSVAALGYREIVLTGIETCSYQYGLAKLMRTLCEIDGIGRIRLSSVNPGFINERFAEEIKDLPKVCPHFHLSLQSFSDHTLNAMRRRYNAAMIKRNCEAIRRIMPSVCFTADIICGFPGETDEDHEETKANVRALGLLHAHIFPYSKRPGTEAAEMPGQVDERVKAKRCAELKEIVVESGKNVIRGHIERGDVLSALFETRRDGYCYGHTENFISVRVATEENLCGKICPVRLTALSEGDVQAEAVIN